MALSEYAKAVGDKVKQDIKNKLINGKVKIIIGAVAAAILLICSMISAFAMGSSEENNVGMQGASGTAWEQFKRSVLIHEGGTRVDANGNKNANGEYYIVEDDSKGNPTVGHGLCLKSYADNSAGAYLHVEEFKAYGLDSKKLADDYEAGQISTVKVEIADEIWNNHLKGLYENISSTYTSLKQYQCFALTDVKYRRGNINGFNDKYNELWSASEDKYGEDASSESFSMDTLYSFFNNDFTDTSSGVYKRKKDQWVLFKYGYYDNLGEYWKAGISFSGELYNADGSVSDEKIAEFVDALESEYGLVEANSAGKNIGGRYNPRTCMEVVGTYLGWSGKTQSTSYDDCVMPNTAYMGNNNLGIYQCTWWANGRASEYLGKQVPTNGNGKDVAQNLINAGYGKSISLNDIQPNCVISFNTDEDTGHVAYVEAVDKINGYYYISHCGGGRSWFGIQKVPIGTCKIWSDCNYTLNAICALEK